MYVKNNKGLIAIIIILAILVIALGVYIFKRESIRQWVSKDVQKTTEENNTKYEEDVNKIITLGTGMKRPSQYKPSEQYYIIDNRKYELNTLVNSLKNEELKKEINTFIKESTDKLENKRSDFQQYIEEGNKEREKIERAGNKLDYYRVISTNGNSGEESDPIQIFTEWKCTNGYLSISLSYKYAYGTGMKRPSNYKPTDSYCIYEYKYELEDLVNNLNNVQLKNEINTFIKESKTKLTKDEVEFKKYIDEGNKLKGSIIDQDNNKYNYYVPQVKEYYNGYMSYSDNQENDIGIITDWKCVNGYLSIAFYYRYMYGEIYGNVMGEEVRSYGIYKSYCATYDLYTGKKIQLSDLFFEGEDYSTELYELMQSKMSVGGYGNYIKRDFSTLEKNYEKFTLNSIFFDKQNTVFSEGAIIPTEYYYTIFPVITIGRDMKGIFNDKIEINEFAKFGFRNQIVQTEVNEIPYKIPKIKHWDDKIGEKINTNIEKYMEYIMKNYKDILDTSNLARGSYQGNTVELSYNEEKNIRYIINYKSAYPFIEIIVNRYTGELESVEPSMGMDTIKPNSIPWSDALEKMKGL